MKLVAPMRRMILFSFFLIPAATEMVLLIGNTATARSIGMIAPNSRARTLLKLESPAAALLE